MICLWLLDIFRTFEIEMFSRTVWSGLHVLIHARCSQRHRLKWKKFILGGDLIFTVGTSTEFRDLSLSFSVREFMLLLSPGDGMESSQEAGVGEGSVPRHPCVI